MLHDGLALCQRQYPYRHALNKILKDVITRSFQMRGYNSNYVPGLGLPRPAGLNGRSREEHRAARRRQGRSADQRIPQGMS
ncbi:class I tRNA ligase family protein [Brucella abortus]|nr:class I tRNA ligase family protein [Brucella abortus]